MSFQLKTGKKFENKKIIFLFTNGVQPVYNNFCQLDADTTARWSSG